jgi:DNA polymerase-3 subunit beta
MEATIAQSDLSKAFRALKLTLPHVDKALIPATCGVYLSGNATTNVVIATTFNTDSFTQVELPAYNVVDGSRVVPGKLFMDLVNKLEGDLEITQDQKNSVHTLLSYDGGKPARIAGFDPNTYPSLPHFNAINAFDITTNELKMLVKRTAWAYSTGDDQASMALQGVAISLKPDPNGTGGILSFSCTNRVDAAYKEIPVSATGDFDLVIDAQQLASIASIMPDGQTCTISWDRAFVMFQSTPVTYFGRQLAANFPNLKGNLNKILAMKTSTFEAERAELVKALERVHVMVSGREVYDNIATFKYTASELSIEGYKADSGDIFETVQGLLVGPDVEFVMKVNLVLNALRVMDADQIIMSMTGANTPMVIHPSSGTDEMYLGLTIVKKSS